MKEYNILVYLNRIPESYKILEDLEKSRLYFLKHSIDIKFDIKKSDIRGYISQFYSYKNRWLLSGAQKLLLIDNFYDTTIFVFDQGEWELKPGMLRPNVPTGSCITEIHKPFISVGSYPAHHAIGITETEIKHEIMHSLVQNAVLQNIYIPDVMDTYRENSNPDSLTGNFSEQWILLKPYLFSANDKVVLTRHSDDGVQTLGDIEVGKVFSRVTLERPWKDNKPNISCVPKGIYSVKWTYSWKFLKYTYELQNVKGRSGIRIHSANYFFDLLGCISLGTGYQNINGDTQVDIINSKVSIKAFEDLMQKKDFQLLIQ